MKLRIALSLLTVLILTMTAVPASAGVLLYSNGPPDGNIYGWEIDSGSVVSDTFAIHGFGAMATSFVVGLWVLPGQMPTGLDWTFSSTEDGPGSGGSYTFAPGDLTLWGTAYGFIGSNGTGGTNCTAGCPLYLATVNFSGFALVPGIYWLNLMNATATSGPVGWDENNGPNSVASQSSLGTIGSEDPDIYGIPNGTTPEPGSVFLLGSGLVGAGGLLRRRMKR